MIPKKGDRFMVEKIVRKNGIEDHSYDRIVFECDYSDDVNVVARVVIEDNTQYVCFCSGKIVNFHVSECIFSAVNEAYIKALHNVPGNGFGFIRTGVKPKLVLSPAGDMLIDEKDFHAVNRLEHPEFYEEVVIPCGDQHWNEESKLTMKKYINENNYKNKKYEYNFINKSKKYDFLPLKNLPLKKKN